MGVPQRQNPENQLNRLNQPPVPPLEAAQQFVGAVIQPVQQGADWLMRRIMALAGLMAWDRQRQAEFAATINAQRVGAATVGFTGGFALNELTNAPATMFGVLAIGLISVGYIRSIVAEKMQREGATQPIQRAYSKLTNLYIVGFTAMLGILAAQVVSAYTSPAPGK